MMDERRGKTVAVVGVCFQAAFSLVMAIVWLWTRSAAAMAGTWFVAAGVPLWVMAAILFYCRELERRESLEIEDLAARGGQQAALFERRGQLELRPAARRLAWTERWIAPAFTLLWAGVHVTTGVLMVRYLARSSPRTVVSPAQGLLFLLLIGFMAYLFSYYCLGMARKQTWRVLRATGSYLLVNAIVIGGAVVAMVAYWQEYRQLDRIVAWVVPVAQLVLSVELLLNFVLDLYRPRLPDQEHRFAFDSRLFNLIAEPGKVGHSIAETINYQFGFEVSKTWFYQLVSRATVPLLGGAALVLVALSCLVVVRNGQQAVVGSWGRLPPDGRLLEPGLHLKWPWPIQAAHLYDLSRVHEVSLGTGEKRSAEEIQGDYVNGKEVFLWTRSHGERQELDFLIAVPPRPGAGPEEGRKPPPPVSIVKLVVNVQYVIRDVYRYAYEFIDGQQMLECLAYRELTRYFASATLDAAVDEAASDRPQAIMTFGRQQAAARLMERIQLAADRMDLGVQITHVGLLGVHPPPDVAPEYENVLKAEREQEQRRFEAEANAVQALTRCSADPVTALSVALSIQTLDEMKELKRLRTRPQEFRSELDKYLRASEQDLQEFRREVEQERRMGRLLGELGAERRRLTDKERLRDAHAQHVALLNTLGAAADAPERFDFDSPIAAIETDLDDPRTLGSGEPAAIIAQAYAERWSRELAKRAEWEAFSGRLLAYRASPSMYRWDRWLAVWDEALPRMHKYVLATDPNLIEIRLDWRREPSALESAVEFTGTHTGGKKPE